MRPVPRFALLIVALGVGERLACERSGGSGGDGRACTERTKKLTKAERVLGLRALGFFSHRRNLLCSRPLTALLSKATRLFAACPVHAGSAKASVSMFTNRRPSA